MLCIFRRLRGYLLFLQMSQLPLVSLSRTRLMRGRRLIGNIFFWLGIFTGPSLLCICCSVGVKYEGEAKGQFQQVGDGIHLDPADHSTKRAILLLTDSIADQLAANGYFVVMPDPFHGDPAPLNRPDGFDLMAWLKGLPGNICLTPGGERIGAIGYCFGVRSVVYVSTFLTAKYAIRMLQPGGCDVAYLAHLSFVEIDELAAIKGSSPVSFLPCSSNVSIWSLTKTSETQRPTPSSCPKRHESEDILAKTGQPYQINLFSGVQHGFAVRGDISKPIIRFAKESAFTQAVAWFNQYLQATSVSTAVSSHWK
ncbi:Sterol O-acyltransferase [Penicillium atrosanguineum]|nr:Sterol O-acyltransferase [Penicillium atrosanguineum]